MSTKQTDTDTAVVVANAAVGGETAQQSLTKCKEDLWENLKALWLIWVPSQVCALGCVLSVEWSLGMSSNGFLFTGQGESLCISFLSLLLLIPNNFFFYSPTPAKQLCSHSFHTQYVNFKYMPPHLRVPFVAGVSALWCVIMSVFRGDTQPLAQTAQATEGVEHMDLQTLVAGGSILSLSLSLSCGAVRKCRVLCLPPLSCVLAMAVLCQLSCNYKLFTHTAPASHPAHHTRTHIHTHTQALHWQLLLSQRLKQGTGSRRHQHTHPLPQVITCVCVCVDLSHGYEQSQFSLHDTPTSQHTHTHTLR